MPRPFVLVLLLFAMAMAPAHAARPNRVPVANPGGPYAAVVVNTEASVSGAASRDPDGSIVSCRWTFGDGSTTIQTSTPGCLAAHVYTAIGYYTATLTVVDNRGASGQASVTMTVVDVATPPADFTWTLCATETAHCGFAGTKQIRYGANSSFTIKIFTDGVDCTSSAFGGDPLYGVVKHCDVGADAPATAPTPTPTPTPTTARGPQTTITCPSGATSVAAGTSSGALQTLVTNSAAGTVFCLKAGTYLFSSSVVPKSDDVFMGEYGAVLDGSNWSTTDDVAAAFRCYGGMGVSRVTIRNLAIRRMPQKGIYVADTCLNWTFENDEITGSMWGISPGAGSTLRNNYFHHNGLGVRGGNYSIYLTSSYPGTTVLVENNEIAFGGDQQKAINSGSIAWRNNYVHDNEGAGIWNDGEGAGSVIESNLIENNRGQGVFWELSYSGIIRNNTIRGTGDQAIFLSTSRDTQVSGNVLEDNARGVVMFLNCPALIQGWPWNPDLANLTVNDNMIRVGTPIAPLTDVFASMAAYAGECDATKIATYFGTGSTKNLRFTGNRYAVPNLAGGYWFWSGAVKTFTQWQVVPQDTTGTVTQR